MSNRKLPQGSDYHGSGKYYSKRDIYREKFPKGSDWKESGGSNHGIKTIGYLKVNNNNLIMCDYKSMSKKELEEFADKMRIERNSFLLEKERLEERIKELETELYFCNRNKRIGEIVDRQRLL